MSWRDRARPIIDRVLAETCGQPERDIRKALHDAYPFGQRRYHPYKIWCDEIRRQRGLTAGHAAMQATMQGNERGANGDVPVTRDDFPFRNRYSPQSHRLCRDPLCLTCLMAERDNYELVRYYPRTETRLFLLKHCRGKLRTIDGTEEKSA